MARVCSQCGRGSMRSASRSHSNIKTIRRQLVNLQKARISGRSVLVCTNCLRTLTRQREKVAV
ncbi:MAG: L28 family ribosomal protein [Patescibacteria group bacterium]